MPSVGGGGRYGYFLELHNTVKFQISPGAYIFQRPFLRGLFLEGLIFWGAYVWREICVSKSIGLKIRWGRPLRAPPLDAPLVGRSLLVP